MSDRSPPCCLPARDPAAHKGTFGRVMLIGGSRGMAGSIALSSIAALHSGSGLVAAAVPDPVLETVAGFHPAVMTLPLDADGGRFGLNAWRDVRPQIHQQSAVGCGPGMTVHRGSVALVEGLLRKRDLPLVLDADALNVVVEQKFFVDERFGRSDTQAPLVLTPHPGELQRLTGAAAADVSAQVEAARELAERLGLVIVVKGGPSHVVDGFAGKASAVWASATGNPGMATAGSGDVLTGVITSLLGQGLSGWDAARLGVWIHGRAGDVAVASHSQVGMTAWHLVNALATIADEMKSGDSGQSAANRHA